MEIETRGGASLHRVFTAVYGRNPTVRHRTARTKNGISRSTFLGLAFKLVQEAEKTWLRIRKVERIEELSPGWSSEMASRHRTMKPSSSGRLPDQPKPAASHTRFDFTQP
jgi:hypothetical protein